jgi:preprotein translocase subunit Sec61beta
MKKQKHFLEILSAHYKKFHDNAEAFEDKLTNSPSLAVIAGAGVAAFMIVAAWFLAALLSSI